MSKEVLEVTDQSFEQEVLKSSQPVLVDFWAEWCAPCRIMGPAVQALAEKYAGAARVVKLNVDDNPAIAQRFGIKGIPTFIVFKDGKESERVVGAIAQDGLARLVEKYVVPATA
jgi:thioredoxin